MKTFAIIPVSRFSHAKTRLSPTLTPIERENLLKSMLKDVIKVLKKNMDGVLVISSDKDVLEYVDKLKVLSLKEEGETETKKEPPFLSKIPILGFIMSSSSKQTLHSEYLVLLTPRIIEGDELTTGYERDFGHRLDKEDQAYPPFTKDSTEYTYKSYQDYGSLKSEQVPDIKPMKFLKK